LAQAKYLWTNYQIDYGDGDGGNLRRPEEEEEDTPCHFLVLLNI